ncbi:MAG: glutamine--fructose-6-phosphate transaminase (isomerizing) [Magnetococcales bacterium]|nr:glutamine--fructose-6-phosphate transaminase (isomerizing) [Magnetococcales bacterium]MBF0323001.1 glutamine--fructose-6-phosphate transaminase (isomerizing) [Magnetococcales bacterium]
MCGIIGVIGERNVTPLLMEGLKRLEYRGYDSAGVAVVYKEAIDVRRAVGKLSNLGQQLAANPLIGFIGIGHTRWATHGPPTELNAHPHRSSRVVVVHNGIIENYLELRQELTLQGIRLLSDTDTEIVPHLIQQQLDQGVDPITAVRQVCKRLLGAFALGILFLDHPDMLVATRRSSPLILGLGQGENFIASDATPLVPYTRSMIYLNDNDVAILQRERVRIIDLDGEPVERAVKQSLVSAEITEKWPYRHFMQKEIFEQPTAIAQTLKEFLNPLELRIADFPAYPDLTKVRFVNVVACGTSYHAGLVAKYWIEGLAGIPVGVDVASEFRYRQPPLAEMGLTVVISQSGETADTLACLRHVKAAGQPVLAIVNVPESSIAREADAVLYTRAGPEIGVASTKAFTTQLAVLACLSIALGRAAGRLPPARESQLVEQLQRLPSLMDQVLAHDEAILNIARGLMHATGFLFLGRGTCYPIALEGALKLKEISYIHAEGYAAGEMKHGPIALIDEELPVVVVAPRDHLFEKVVSNLEEVKARGGRVVLISSHGAMPHHAPTIAHYSVLLDASGDFIAPLLYVIPLQLLAYHIAVLKGTDVDQPRNLAKSVTVE